MSLRVGEKLMEGSKDWEGTIDGINVVDGTGDVDGAVVGRKVLDGAREGIGVGQPQQLHETFSQSTEYATPSPL